MHKKSSWSVGPDHRPLLFMGACTFSAIISMAISIGLMSSMLIFAGARAFLFAPTALGFVALAGRGWPARFPMTSPSEGAIKGLDH